MVPRYLKTIDDLYINPTLPLNTLHTVSVAPDLIQEGTAIGTFRANRDRQSGRVRLIKATVASVDLTSRPTAKPKPVLPAVHVTACIDVTGVKATDPQGKSLVPPGRPPFLVEQLKLVNIEYPSASGWRVSESPNKQANTCAG